MIKNNLWGIDHIAVWDKIIYNQNDELFDYFRSFASIQENGGRYIYLNISNYLLFLRYANPNLIEPITQINVIKTGLYAHIYNIPIYVYKTVPPGVIAFSREKIEQDLLHCFFLKNSNLNNAPMVSLLKEELPSLLVAINNLDNLNKLITLI